MEKSLPVAPAYQWGWLSHTPGGFGKMRVDQDFRGVVVSARSTEAEVIVPDEVFAGDPAGRLAFELRKLSSAVSDLRDHLATAR